MSDGKVLPEKEAGTTFEVLVEVDRKYKVVSKRLDVIEKNLESIQSVLSALPALKSAQDELSDKISAVHSSVKSSISDVKSQRMQDLNNAEERSSQIDALVRGVKSLKQGVEEQFAASSDSVQKIVQQHSDLKASTLPSSEFTSHIKSQSDRFNEIHSSLSDIRREISKVRAEKDQLESVINSQKNGQKIHESKLGSLESSLSQQTSSLSSKIADVHQVVENKVQNVIQKMQQSVDSAKTELLGSPSSLQGAKNELMQKMEAVELDAANALLRSKNSEQKCSVLDRKIDNIYLLLKKHELKE